MPGHVAIFHLLNGDKKTAYETFQTEYNQSRSYWSGFHVILLADEFGDADTRDRMMSVLVVGGVPDQSSSIYALAKYAVLLHDAFDELSGGVLDVEALDQVLELGSENQRMDIAYFAAKLLALRGRQEDSERFLHRCYASTDIGQLNRTLAGAELTDAGYSADELEGSGMKR